MQEPDRNFSEVLHAITIGLQDKIAGVVTKAQQIFENLLNQCTGINAHHLVKTNMDFAIM